MGYQLRQRFHCRQLVFILLLFCFFMNGNTGYGEAATAQFNYAMLFSDNRRFDPEQFQFNLGNPYYNGQEYWLMVAVAELDYDTEPVEQDPVTVTPITPDGGVPGTYTLTEWGVYGAQDHFNIRLFMDNPNLAFPGVFYPPGDDWDNRTYTFQVQDTTYAWEIPDGSLQQLAIPEVTITPGYYPTITWSQVPDADYYRVRIYPLNDNGFIISEDLLFISGVIPADTLSYTYTGDIFKDGREYGIWTQAVQVHDSAGCADDPAFCIINRSGFITKHRFDISSVPCDVNGDRSVNMADTVTGLQALAALPAPGVNMPEGEALDFQEILCSLQVQAEFRTVDTDLIDWDYDGYNAFSGDCDETDSDINPGQPEICGDDIDNNCDGQTDEDCSETTPTPAGSNVSVSALGFDLLFDTVTVAGETTAEVLPSVPGPPAGFLFAGTYFDVSTTAQFSGSVQVCINYDDTGLGPEEEAGLQIFHYDSGGGSWENITSTTIEIDTELNRVCGETTSLSPFVLGFSSLLGD